MKVVRVCVPAALTTMVMAAYHDANGHPGGTRLKQSIQTEYYWPKMNEDCKTYVASCIWCMKVKIDHHQGHISILLLPIGTRPFDIVHIDMVTMPRPKQGYADVFGAVCELTKF